MHIGFRSPASSFSLVAGEPSRHIHLAFGTGAGDPVHAVHRAAAEAGHSDKGLPAERPVHHDGYYPAFVCDPDGNHVEVVNHHRSDA
jgi:predicted lactoylglutathione lyase